MLSRTILSAILLLSLALFLLTNCATPSEASPQQLPITPPPVVPQPARIGPRLDEPLATITSTVVNTTIVTSRIALTPTQALSATATLTIVAGITPTMAASLLPTVTPTPPALVLLPTPGPSRTGVLAPTPIADTAEMITPTATAILTPTATPTTSVPISPSATSAISEVAGISPPAQVTASVPLTLSYVVEGSFSSQTVYTDSTVVQQQGRFTITQVEAPNEYGANQQYTLSAQRTVGQADEINVYQIDDYIAVNYTGGDWMLARRDQGSNIVRAIQPISDLAILFPRIISQAEFVGQANIGDISALHYRIDDPKGQGARLIQPLLALSGDIRSLILDVWIAVPGGYVVSYDFLVELSGALVLDRDGNEVLADQAVSWSYQLTPTVEPPPITWPDDAPTPDAYPVPGFALGEFPVPPNTELLTLVSGLPELISTLSPIEIDSFYRTELFERGWTIEGTGGLLSGRKEGTTIQILMTEDTASGGTRITILPAE